ncbi:MAG: hypothetical protein Q8N92_07615 [Erysipelotrichaceae bacterium]|nr:hypothetical protein [Erysipelotrichaceae bacterium]
MKEKMASLLFTILLGTILTLLIITNIFVYVSGPARKAEVDDEALFRSVVNAYQLVDATFLNRHFHQRITYVAQIGADNDKLIFYDEEGLVFLLLDTPVRPQVINELLASGQIMEKDISYGYFKTPVFVIDSPNRLQYINVSGETVFFLKKGD